MEFAFATVGNIIFGAGASGRAVPDVARLGRFALVVTGSRPDRAADFTQELESSGLAWTGFVVSGEPDTALVARGAKLAREHGCDMVIGFGGGSALDAAKAIAALAANPLPVEAYLEVVGQGRPLENACLPCVAIPTTAGTGSEVTRNAVLTSRAHHAKVSLRSPWMLPVLAIVDPELTRSLPPAVTATTGCDALTQLLEAFVSSKANPMTDALCREALPRAARALPRCVANGTDMDARTDMALASLFSGLCLANAGLGAVHGIAGPLGGMIGAPHGALCARLLPYVVEANVAAISRGPDKTGGLQRFAEAARLLTGSPKAAAPDLVDWLHRLVARLDIPFLSDWGLAPDSFGNLVEKARRASSMKANPVELDGNALAGIIRRAMRPPQ